MTNEEKAKELLGAPIQWTFNYWLDGFSEATQKELSEKRNLLIKMAEWKDQQFKKYLESKAICAKEKRDADNSYGCDCDKGDERYSVYMRILNELFGEK